MGKLIARLQTDGVLATIGSLPRVLRFRIMAAADRQFEANGGLDTEAVRERAELASTIRDREFGFDYVATPKRVFDTIVANLPKQRDSFTFVDYGCGKGKVLLMACRHGFSKAVGVELSSELVAIAEKNVELFSRRHQHETAITVRNQGATAFEIPMGDCVLFFNNPFNESVMRSVLTRVETSLQQPKSPKIYFVYLQLRDEPESDRTDNLLLLDDCVWLRRIPLRCGNPFEQWLLASHDIAIYESLSDKP